MNKIEICQKIVRQKGKCDQLYCEQCLAAFGEERLVPCQAAVNYGGSYNWNKAEYCRAAMAAERIAPAAVILQVESECKRTITSSRHLPPLSSEDALILEHISRPGRVWRKVFITAMAILGGLAVKGCIDLAEASNTLIEHVREGK
jgi:hypothetical protein